MLIQISTIEKKIQNIVFLFFITLYSFSNDIKVIDVDTNVSIIDLTEYTYVFSTKNASLKINEISTNEFLYTPKGLRGINDNSIHWERFVFNNKTNKTVNYYIYFPYSVTNKIIAYSEYKNDIKYLISTGLYYGRKNKKYDAIGYPILLELHPGKNTVFIKIDHIFQGLRTVSYLLKEDVLHDTVKKTDHVISIWKGFFLFALLISIIIFAVTKIKMFLYYFLLNFGIGMFFLGEIGEISNYLEIIPPNITGNIKQTGTLIMFFFVPLLINQIIPISKLKPKMWKYMFLTTFTLSLTWLGCLIPYVQTTYFLYFTTYFYNIYSVIFLILQLYFIFEAYRAKIRNARTLFIGYSIYILFTFIYIILPNLGFLKNSLNVYNLFIYGSMIEIFTFMSLIGKEMLNIHKQRSALLEKQKDHQAEIIRAIVESQEKERNKVGRELHDMIGANISVIKQQVDKNNTKLMSVIERTIDSVRNLSHGLVTPLIKDDEFVDEINELCVLSSNLDIKIQSHFHNWTKIDDAQKATHLYRIVQELLQNAVKHSNAKNVLIQFIVNKEKELTIMYEDDGKGFDYKKAYKNNGLGLINIENRIKLIEASIIYDTKQGRKGTTVIINVIL